MGRAAQRSRRRQHAMAGGNAAQLRRRRQQQERPGGQQLPTALGSWLACAVLRMASRSGGPPGVRRSQPRSMASPRVPWLQYCSGTVRQGTEAEHGSRGTCLQERCTCQLGGICMGAPLHGRAIAHTCCTIHTCCWPAAGRPAPCSEPSSSLVPTSPGCTATGNRINAARESHEQLPRAAPAGADVTAPPCPAHQFKEQPSL